MRNMDARVVEMPSKTIPPIGSTKAPDRQDRSLAQQLSRTFAIFGALVGGALCVAVLSFGFSLGWLIPEVQRSRMAATAEADANAAMLDEENGLRAYLLTGEDRYLGPYVAAQIALEQAHRELAASIATVADLAPGMLSTRLAEERFYERWGKLAAETPPGGTPPSLAEGKALFDAYRGEQAAFANAIHQHTAVLSIRGERAIEAYFVLVSVLLTALLFVTWRQHHALQKCHRRSRRALAARHPSDSRRPPGGDHRSQRAARAS